MSETYASLDALRAHIDATGAVEWSAADIINMETALEAASRWIDERLDTRFYTATETRFYTTRWNDLVHIDDLVSLDELATDDGNFDYATEWDTGDYILEPINAAGNNRPYRQIRRRSNGRYSFPVNMQYGVRVTGAFGYAAVPPGPIAQACLLVAHRLWMRKEAVFGVAGTPGLGVTVVQARIQADADVLAMLEGVERRYV